MKRETTGTAFEQAAFPVSSANIPANRASLACIVTVHKKNWLPLEFSFILDEVNKLCWAPASYKASEFLTHFNTTDIFTNIHSKSTERILSEKSNQGTQVCREILEPKLLCWNSRHGNRENNTEIYSGTGEVKLAQFLTANLFGLHDCYATQGRTQSKNAVSPCAI